MYARVAASALARRGLSFQLYNNTLFVRTSTSLLSVRHFSDRLLGHSPMAAPSTTAQNKNTAIPTQQDVTTAGGIWAPTSAKRDALAELKVESPRLDDAATPAELLDLYLCDGMQCLARVSDNNNSTMILGKEQHIQQQQQQLDEWWKNDMPVLGRIPKDDDCLRAVQWEEFLGDFIKQTDQLLSTLPADRYLEDIRDFYMPADSDETNFVWTPSEQKALTAGAAQFDKAALRFRLLLAKAAAQKLADSWTLLTTVTDQDVDRAAVSGVALDRQASSLSAHKLTAVLESFWRKSCAERVDALWALIDRDEDGCLDQDEVTVVCDLAIQPVGQALTVLLQEALEASSVRVPFVEWDLTQETLQPVRPPAVGWRQRRRDAKVRKKLTRMFQKTVRFHFRDEVEQAHRLRCIYAWANKEHQDDKVKSVMVDEVGWSGRKRYVELQPKIRLSEFREVQQVHFSHLDRVGQEFLKSFREDLLVMQGKRRQRKELIRDCGIFLTVVSMVDFIIVSL